MAAPTAAQCHALTSYYIKTYKSKFNREPVVNRPVARQAFGGILMDMSSEQVKNLIDHMFVMPSAVTRGYQLNWFLYNYDKVQENLAVAEDDRERRRKRLAQSEEKAKRWRERAESRTIGD